MKRKGMDLHDKISDAKLRFLNMRPEEQLEYVQRNNLSSVEIAALDACKMFMKSNVKKAYNQASQARENAQNQPMQ